MTAADLLASPITEEPSPAERAFDDLHELHVERSNIGARLAAADQAARDAHRKFNRRQGRRTLDWAVKQQAVLDALDAEVAGLTSDRDAIDERIDGINAALLAQRVEATHAIEMAVVETVCQAIDAKGVTFTFHDSPDYPSIYLACDGVTATVYGPRPQYDWSEIPAVVNAYSKAGVNHPSSSSSWSVDEAATMARLLAIAVAIARAWDLAVTI